MKRFAFLVFLLSLGFSTITRYGTLQEGWIIDEIINEQVLSGNSIVVKYDLGKLTNINFAIGTQSSGNISSATLTWLSEGGKTLSTNTLTIGSPHTRMFGKKFKISIANDVQTTINVTGSITIR